MDYRIVSKINPNLGKIEYNIQYKQYGFWRYLNCRSDVGVQEHISFKTSNEAEDFINNHEIYISVPNISEKIKNKDSNEYKEFLQAYDNINIESLSNDELQSFKALCDNGVIDAQREERKRGL